MNFKPEQGAMTTGHRIGDVDLDREILVIAEIGNNHEGDPKLAAEMVTLAAEAGAHAVKFQSIDPPKLVSPQQKDRIAQLERFRLAPDDVLSLAALASSKGLIFLSTPFHLGAVDELDPLVPAFKVASGDNEFLPLLEKIAITGKPVLMSCGLADLSTIEASQEAIRRVWRANRLNSFLVLLHCVSSYPTPPDEANLRAISALATMADVVGYSDHTLGIEAAVAAAALGARVIEKHFTIDKNHSDFRDHKLSADPDELKLLCDRVAVVNRMLGNGEKRKMACEAPLVSAAKRSVAAARDLPQGTILSAADITWLRPGGGIPPGGECALIGLPLRRAVQAGDILRPEDLGK
jgi:N-acetylneuraminate synthase/N,N'-diacetyllegionaminate synthase